MSRRKASAPDPRPPRPPRPRRFSRLWLTARLSLTARLTLCFTVVAALLMLGLGILVLLETGYHFVELDRMALQDRQHVVEGILRDATSPADARARLAGALSNHHDLLVRVRDAAGSTIFMSAGVEPAIGDGTGYRTLAFEAAPAWAEHRLQVLLAAGTEHHRQFLADLRRSLAAYALAAILVCGLLAWFAARQGLRPLRTMKARAAAVTAQRLGERMPVAAVPVEMADLADELNRMLDRLQEDFLRLTVFSSDLAHELRTPISNLLTQTQVALANRRDAATYREILASNAEEFQRLARMVSDMLFFAKTEHGVDLPRKEVFAARGETLALLAFYEAVADEKAIRIRLDGDGLIEGDRLMVRRAISNLLSNALRHAPPAGDIRVCIQPVGSATQVTVENTGPDIDARDLPRLFDRFYRADPSRAHAGSDGSGLGLAITRAIVEAHGGSIEVASAGGRTRFALRFPRQPGFRSH